MVDQIHTIACPIYGQQMQIKQHSSNIYIFIICHSIVGTYNFHPIFMTHSLQFKLFIILTYLLQMKFMQKQHYLLFIIVRRQGRYKWNNNHHHIMFKPDDCYYYYYYKTQWMMMNLNKYKEKAVMCVAIVLLWFIQSSPVSILQFWFGIAISIYYANQRKHRPCQARQA